MDRGFHPPAYRRSPFTRRAEQGFRGRRFDGNPDIYAIEEGPAYLSPMSLQFLDRTEASPALSSKVAAGARVRRQKELEFGGKASDRSSPHERNVALLDGLPQRLEDIGAKLGRLIEEEEAFVRKADFPGPEATPPSYHPFERSRVMGSAHWRPPLQRGSRPEQAGQ
jgi:hypothetical protein